MLHRVNASLVGTSPSKRGERYYLERASVRTVIRFCKLVELGAPLML